MRAGVTPPPNHHSYKPTEHHKHLSRTRRSLRHLWLQFWRDPRTRKPAPLIRNKIREELTPYLLTTVIVETRERTLKRARIEIGKRSLFPTQNFFENSNAPHSETIWILESSWSPQKAQQATSTICRKFPQDSVKILPKEKLNRSRGRTIPVQLLPDPELCSVGATWSSLTIAQRSSSRYVVTFLAG